MTMAQPKHPELTIEALTAWLRKQDPDQEYVWSDPAFCLMGHYMAAHDSSWGTVSYSELPNYYEIAAAKPWNFGAALKRAEALPALTFEERGDFGPGYEAPVHVAMPELELVALPAPETAPS